jgi:regulator of replication initiation timing
MIEEMIEELDRKVEFLIDKNVRYRHEIERLRGLLIDANNNNFASQKPNGTLFDELKPLAESILARIEKTYGE